MTLQGRARLSSSRISGNPERLADEEARLAGVISDGGSAIERTWPVLETHRESRS